MVIAHPKVRLAQFEGLQTKIPELLQEMILFLKLTTAPVYQYTTLIRQLHYRTLYNHRSESSEVLVAIADGNCEIHTLF